MELLVHICQAYGTGPSPTGRHLYNRHPSTYGRGRQITAPAVNSAITAVGKTIAMARGVNLTKTVGSDKLLPRLKQMLDGWTEEDPPTIKKLPIEVDIPEYIVNAAHQQPNTSHNLRRMRRGSIV